MQLPPEELRERLCAVYQETFEQICQLSLRTGMVSAAVAEEIAQDTFKTALEEPEKFLKSPNPRGWLVKTAKLKLCAHIRAQQRCRRMFESYEALELLPAGAIPASASAERSVLERERREKLREAVDSALSPEERRLLEKFVLRGKSYAQIAGEEGLSLWSCQKRVQRSRKKLKRVIREIYGAFREEE